MAADFSLQQGDRMPGFQATLAVGGVPIDLTLAVSVAFIMRPIAGGTPKVNSPATIVNAPGGVVRYDWGATDTDTVGIYQGQWKITWPTSKVQHVPTLTFYSIEVTTNLG